MSERPAPAGRRRRRPPGRPRASALSALAVGAALVVSGCSGGGGGGTGGPAATAPTGTAPPATSALEDALKLNQIQVIGTHNSYHQRTPQVFRDKLESYIPGLTSAWNYGFPPLDQQLDAGVRQLELDVHVDPDGRYATRHANRAAGLSADAPPEMREPGLKVFHIAEVDYESSCLTFKACLTVLSRWSDAHPGHVPIMVLIEAKDDTVPDPLAMGFTPPVKWDASNLGQIDDEIRSVLPASKLITPDNVRGSAGTLEAAVRAGAWPTLGASRGKFLFALDNADLAAAYAGDRASLEGRVLFTDGPPGTPRSAFVEQNDPLDPRGGIEALVAQGYLVRTIADGKVTATAADTARRDAALASGAQWLSTDYYVPDPALNPSYRVAFAEPGPRCNPVTAPPGCTASAIEPAPGRTGR